MDHGAALDLADRVPDHSTFSKSRHGRFRDSDLLREVFEGTVRACIAAGLVAGERFAVDASPVEADLGLDRRRLRGPNGARDEFHLAAAAQNLRKLARLTVQSVTPSPA